LVNPIKMKTKQTDQINYDFDAEGQRLNIIVNGKPAGGFIGPSAEREFSRLLDTGANINLTDMSDSIKSAKVRRLRAIWHKQGVDQYRESILEPYGVASTADLTAQQLDELIDRFNNKNEVTAVTRSLRSDVLVTLDKLGIYADNGDWKRVNAFLMQPKIAGKMLFQMCNEELTTLNRKLRSMLAKKADIDAEINRKKLLN